MSAKTPPFLSRKIHFASNSPSNQKLLTKLRIKRLSISHIHLENPSLLQKLTTKPFKSLLKPLTHLTLSQKPSPQASQYLSLLPRKTSPLLKSLHINFEIDPNSLPNLTQNFLSKLPPSFQAIKLLIRNEQTMLLIPNIYHILRKYKACQLSLQNLRFSPQQIKAPPKVQPGQITRSKYIRNLVLSPSLIQNAHKLGLDAKIVGKIPSLEALSVIGTVSAENLLPVICYLRELGAQGRLANLKSFTMKIYSEDDICKLTNAIASFLSQQNQLSAVNFHIDYPSTLYNNMLVQSIMALKTLESLNLTINKWDTVFIVSTISENLKGLVRLRELSLVINDPYLEVETSIWRKLGKSLNELKELKRLCILLPCISETCYGTVFREMSCENLARLENLCLNLVMVYKRGDVRPAKVFFERLKMLTGVKHLSLSLNYGCNDGVQPKVYEAFQEVWKDLGRDVKVLELRLGRMNVKSFVLPGLFENFGHVENLRISLQKGIVVDEWKRMLEVLKTKEMAMKKLDMEIHFDKGFKDIGRVPAERLVNEIRRVVNWERLEIRGGDLISRGNTWRVSDRNDGLLLKPNEIFDETGV